MNKETNDVIRLSRKDDVTMSMCINYILSTHINKKRHFKSENQLVIPLHLEQRMQTRECPRKGYYGEGGKVIINIMTKITSM